MSALNLEKYLPYFFLPIIIGFVVVVRIKLIGIPFERDEGIYHYFGQLILDGKRPYIDFYEMKLPGIYYMYALLNWVFGSSVERAHLAFTGLNLATILILFEAGRRFLNTLAGVVIAASFAILSLAPQMSGFTTQSEHLVAFFASAGILMVFAAIDSRTTWQFASAGMLFAIAMLIKQSGFFFVGFGGFAVIAAELLRRPFARRELIRTAGSYLAGASGIVLISILVVALQGGLQEMVYWVFEVPKTYVSRIPLSHGLSRFSSKLEVISSGYTFLWVLGGLGLALISITKVELQKKLILYALAVCSFLTIWPGFRFYGHYWIQLLPGLAFLVGTSVYAIGELLNGKVSKNVIVSLGMGLFVLAVTPVLAREENYYLRPNYTRILRSAYGMNPFPESRVIGDFIKQRAEEGDQVALIGSEPQIYYYSGLRAPSKHAYFSWTVKGNPRSREFQKEFIRDVEQAEPRYIVYFHHPISLFIQRDADRTVFGWVRDLLRSEYRQIGMIDIVSRNNTVYVWDDKVHTYKRRGKNYIEVFERID